jgi:hypothetical protein
VVFIVVGLAAGILQNAGGFGILFGIGVTIGFLLLIVPGLILITSPAGRWPEAGSDGGRDASCSSAADGLADAGALAGGLLALRLVQLDLAQADRLRRHFNALVVAQELQRRFQR